MLPKVKAVTITRTLTRPTQILYIITDKTLYTPGEVIWFSAYLLNNGKQNDTLQPDIISVALVPQGDTVSAIRKNYFMQGGLCAGSLTLPDSIAAGSYELIACSNVLDSAGMPVHVFRKPLTIKSLEQAPYNLHFQLDRKVSKDSLQVTLQLSFPDAAILSGKHKHDRFSYWLNDYPTHTAELGATGHLFLPLAWKDIATSNHILYTSTTYKGITKTFNLLLPHAPKEKVQVSFFPEYGKLMAGKKQKIIWQCHYKDNAPAAKEALLLKNNMVIDSLQTDSSGTGSFILVPETFAAYSLKVLDRDTDPAAMIFPLPKPVDKGWLLTTDNSLVKDTLQMKATGNTSTIYRWAVKDKDSIHPLTAFMKADSIKKLTFLLNDMAKGMHELIIQDNKGKTIAGKPFFAHYGKDSNVNMKINKTQFAPREKVSVDITLKGMDTTLPGVYTLYCVQTSRIEPKLQQTMESYYYTYPLTKGNTSLLAYQNKYWLQNRVSASRFNSYSKENALNKQSSSLHKPIIKGKVLFEDGRMGKETITDSLQVVIKRSMNWRAMPVINGIFYPKAKDLVIPEDTTLFAIASPVAKKADDIHYAVQTDDPMQVPAKQIIRQFPVCSFVLSFKNSTETQLIDSALGNMLKTVSVKSRKKGIVADDQYSTNACGDYVCKYNFLNCPEHPPGTPGNYLPIKGQVYNVENKQSPHNTAIVYQGCNTNNIVGIYISRKFHGMDSARLASINKTFLSTLFWQPFVFKQANKKEHIEFYVGDLQGSFKIIAEGVDANGQIFYNAKTFMVKAK